MRQRCSRALALAFVLIVLAHHGMMAMNPHGNVSDSLAETGHHDVAVMACGVSESRPLLAQPAFDPPPGDVTVPIAWLHPWSAAIPANLSWTEPVQTGSVLRAVLQVFLN